MSVEGITARGRTRMSQMFAIRGQWAVVYELSETVEADGTLTRLWTEVGAANASFSQSLSVRLATYGATEMPAGQREIQFVAPFDVLAARHVVDITTGPEGGTRWRVLFVDRSDRIRVRALVDPFNDELV